MFLALALIGVPTALGGWLHVALIVVFAVALMVALYVRVRRLALPRAADAQRRVEQASGLAHRPLTALEDELSDPSQAATRALWRTHKARIRAAVRRLRVGLPRPGLAARDPYALRALVFLALLVGLATGGHDGGARLALAFTPSFSHPIANPAELDVWINPPAYTGVPPFRLSMGEGQTPVRVPAESEVLARVFGGEGTPELRLDDVKIAFRTIDALNHELKHKVTAGERLVVGQGERVLGAWALDVLADGAPHIALAEAPSATQRGALRLDYEAHDDYGLAELKAEFRLQGEPDGDVLERPLPLPGPGVREAADARFHDLTPHPWAGLPVTLRLLARDVIGQVGQSEDFQMVLPERAFRHPVARAIIEQRKRLVRDPTRRRTVALALRAIASVPESFDHDVVAYLALRTAFSRLRLAGRDEAVSEIIDLLWDTALHIEDGRLSLVERELRAAQQALMEALARNADDAEIEQLMDRLQAAMERYLQALAEQAMRQADEGQEPLPFDPESRMVEAEQLQQMLERARELSRLGARDAARELLRQLQEMLENLRAGPMMAMPPELQGTDRAMRELGDLMRQQQRLLDRTFRETPRGQHPGQPGGRQRMEGQGSREPFPGMARDQEGLRRQLGEVMRRLGERLGEIPGALGRAERAMRDARESLSQGEPVPATEAQSRAIDQLAEGLRGLAQEMARQLGRGEGGDEEFGTWDEDPLGRPAANGGLDTSNVRIPEEADLQRAREILDELRRRAGERRRPMEERDYIERLLRQF